MIHDMVPEDKLSHYLSVGLEGDDVDDFSLLKHEPVWAGLLDFRGKLVMDQLGQVFVHRPFLVEVAAYLYSAARAALVRFSEHQDSPDWVDMERFLASYIDHGNLKRGILNHQDDPIAIIKSSKYIISKNVMESRPENINLNP